MRKHSDLPITFASWYQCNRLDEISSGIEDLVEYGAIISKGEEFNIFKALGYEILGGSNVTEGEAYMAGKRKYEEIRKQKEEEARAEMERRRLFEEAMEESRKAKAKNIKPTSIWLPFLIVICCPALLIFAFAAILCPNELYNLICNNIFFIALFLIPSTIIFVGHKIETKKKQNSLII